MHLKSCQSLVRPAGGPTSLQRGAVYVSQPLARSCGGNHGNVPLGIVPTNTLRSHAASRAALQLLPPAALCESGRAGLFRDDEALLDLWTVIKPGHVREKIAIFAAEVRASSVAAGPEQFPDQDQDQVQVQAPRPAKAKGNWEQSVNAKRRRRSSKTSPPEACGRGLSESPEDKVSVGRMVAFLEQQASLQQTGTKAGPKSPGLRAPETRDKGEEPASVSVSNMVARLESECLRRRSAGDLSRSGSLRRSAARVLLAEPRPAPPEEEPPPGLLFLSAPVAWSAPGPPLLARSQSERLRSPGVRVARRVSASQDFLEARRRLRRLLEPQAYLSLLPLHLLVQVFQLLPTQSLAALQCTCHYFKFVIQTYGIRPADSLWVSDPRYRDDPCKQCKKRYGRGDVSLCRWHHKPYCQALPYGPGYWMCCHDVRREAAGCNVGLHDNRWVPAFHSIYRRGRQDQ